MTSKSSSSSDQHVAPLGDRGIDPGPWMCSSVHPGSPEFFVHLAGDGNRPGKLSTTFSGPQACAVVTALNRHAADLATIRRQGGSAEAERLRTTAANIRTVLSNSTDPNADLLAYAVACEAGAAAIADLATLRAQVEDVKRATIYRLKDRVHARWKAELLQPSTNTARATDILVQAIGHFNEIVDEEIAALTPSSETESPA